MYLATKPSNPRRSRRRRGFQVVCGQARQHLPVDFMAPSSTRWTSERSFRERGILQAMTHGERTMTMTTWPVRFDSISTAVKSAPLLGEHTAEVLADWLGLDAAAVAGLRQDGIV
jgi:hypothetical protein